MKHVHQSIKELQRTQCYTGCVNPQKCVPQAHGNATDIDVCKCGAIRQYNFNGTWGEQGPWQEAQP